MAFKKTKTATEAVIDLKRLSQESVVVNIKGLTPLIPHNWSAKSRRLMPGHPDRDMEAKKGKRDPEGDAEACLYRFADNPKAFGMPATAFKAAMVSACRFFEKPSMTEAKLLFFVVGEAGVDGKPLVKVTGDLELHEDTPRNANGSADLRYRYYVWPWSAKLRIDFVSTSISKASVAALIDAAGRVGIGDWRPGSPKSSTGTFGTWSLVTE